MIIKEIWLYFSYQEDKLAEYYKKFLCDNKNSTQIIIKYFLKFYSIFNYTEAQKLLKDA